MDRDIKVLSKQYTAQYGTHACYPRSMCARYMIAIVLGCFESEYLTKINETRDKSRYNRIQSILIHLVVIS